MGLTCPIKCVSSIDACGNCSVQYVHKLHAAKPGSLNATNHGYYFLQKSITSFHLIIQFAVRARFIFLGGDAAIFSNINNGIVKRADKSGT